MTPSGRASAVPAGGGSSLLHLGRLRASKQSGTTTGRGGASLDWDRRARVTPVSARSFAPGWANRTGPDAPPSRRKHGLKLEPRATKVPLVKAAVERRQASGPLPFPPPLAGEGKGGGRAARERGGYGTASYRRSASCFYFFVGWASALADAHAVRDRTDIT